MDRGRRWTKRTDINYTTTTSTCESKINETNLSGEIHWIAADIISLIPVHLLTAIKPRPPTTTGTGELKRTSSGIEMIYTSGCLWDIRRRQQERRTTLAAQFVCKTCKCCFLTNFSLSFFGFNRLNLHEQTWQTVSGVISWHLCCPILNYDHTGTHTHTFTHTGNFEHRLVLLCVIINKNSQHHSSDTTNIEPIWLLDLELCSGRTVKRENNQFTWRII